MWNADIRQCPQYGLICGFVQPWLFELGDASTYPFPDYSIDKFKMFLKQVRESRGYDISFKPPGSTLSPMYLDIMMKDKGYRKFVNAKCKFVVGKINLEAQMHGEHYVYRKVVKAVEACLSRSSLLTFTVREVSSNVLKTVQAFVFFETFKRMTLKEWRFHPESPGISSDEVEDPESSEEEDCDSEEDG
ncbi:hypothetical protein C2S52_016344 [Perilla frutescens var. hirtella]|uniref:Uncharacterized protein n=1 Tax=Perilla frutescens var. hirtella TaxID=608512 RepID=A0AAD4J632_PERFH|nr:hypothetical protein C2S52_016344 [Perilla frutescens var. hirtella]KAH6827782.1 hypothetical protein C2S53_011859 [Perilla frutescens var. hirtella]